MSTIVTNPRASMQIKMVKQSEPVDVQDGPRFLCRTCLSYEIRANCTSLFFKSELNQEFTNAALVMRIADVHIQEHDKHSQYICYGCMEKLNSAVEFKNLCETNDLKLNNSPVRAPIKFPCKITQVADASSVSMIFEESIDVNDFVTVKQERLVDAGDVDARRTTCAICKQSIVIDELQKHLRAKHWHERDGERVYVCPVCQDAFKTYRATRAHITRHDKKCKPRLRRVLPKIVDANDCVSVGKDVESSDVADAELSRLKEETTVDDSVHIKIETDEQQLERSLRNACVVCDTTYENALEMRKHVESVHVDVDGGFVCRQCNKRFNMYRYLRNHMVYVHYKMRPKRTKRDKRPRDGQKKHLCPYCGRGFTESGNLTQHIMIHEGKKSYPCDECERKFYFKYHLDKHKKSRHSDAKNFACEKCGKSFAIWDQLRVHSARHVTERNHVCDKCSKTFKSKGDLRRHMMYHEEKKFFCDYCQKAFVCKKHLRVHTYIHTGERPQVCKICNKGFAQWSSLKYHMSRHHTNGNDKRARNIVMVNQDEMLSNDGSQLSQLSTESTIIFAADDLVKETVQFI